MTSRTTTNSSSTKQKHFLNQSRYQNYLQQNHRRQINSNLNTNLNSNSKQSPKSLQLPGQTDIARQKILQHYLDANKLIEQKRRERDISKACITFIIKEKSGTLDHLKGFTPVNLERIRAEIVCKSASSQVKEETGISSTKSSSANKSHKSRIKGTSRK